MHMCKWMSGGCSHDYKSNTSEYNRRIKGNLPD